MEYKFQGIVLGKKDIGETDRIYTVYTLEKGKVRALAKGVRKSNAKLAGSLETITQGDFFIARNRGMGKVTGMMVQENYSQIKNDLDLLRDVFGVFHIMSRLISEEEEDREIFFLLQDYLRLMNGPRKGILFQKRLPADFFSS